MSLSAPLPQAYRPLGDVSLPASLLNGKITRFGSAIAAALRAKYGLWGSIDVDMHIEPSVFDVPGLDRAIDTAAGAARSMSARHALELFSRLPAGIHERWTAACAYTQATGWHPHARLAEPPSAPPSTETLKLHKRAALEPDVRTEALLRDVTMFEDLKFRPKTARNRSLVGRDSAAFLPAEDLLLFLGVYRYV